MKKYPVFLRMALVLVLLWGGQLLAAEKQVPRDSFGGFLQNSTTASQKGLFAVYMAVWPERGFDTAVSVSNTLAAPTSIQNVFDQEFNDLEGTVEFYLWALDGTLYTYETGPESPGRGLSQEGTLAPGNSYLVLMSQILELAEYDFDANDGIFAGYGWIIANFDGAQGTANPTDFQLFTQTTVMQPDLGSPLFSFVPHAGLPLAPPEEEPTP
jgi:hypothetical protein